jgi:hypothetical protein
MAATDAKGYCHGHYQRLLRTGTVGESPLNNTALICSVEGCERPHKARGFCQTHYKRVLATGDPRPDEPIRIATGNGNVHHGYRYLPVAKELQDLTNGDAWVAEHRLVMAQHLGRPLFPDEQVHHRNGERLDNRLSNLELWSTSHPSGARIEDLIEFAYTILIRYAASGVSRRLTATSQPVP